MTARRRQMRAAGSETGAATVEQVGLTVAAAVLILAVVVALAPQQFVSSVTRAICQVLTLGLGNCGSSAPTATDAGFKPTECRVRDQSEKYGSEINIGFVRIGQELGFQRQEMADGKVQLTAVGSQSVGVAGGPNGKTFDIGKIGTEVGELEVEGSGTVKVGYGDTWEFSSAEEADKFQADIEEYSSMKSMENAPDSLFIILWNRAVGYPEVPVPTTKVTKVSGDAGVQAGLQVTLQEAAAPGNSNNSNNSNATDEGSAEEAGPEEFDPNVGGLLALKGEYEVTQETKTNGDVSWTYQLAGEGKVEGSAILVGGEAAGKSTGAFKVTRDKDGKLTELSFVSTREGSLQANVTGKGAGKDGEATGKDGSAFTTATVTTTTLKLDNDADRATAQAWLRGNNEQFGSPFGLTYDSLVPDREAAEGDVFGQLMYDKATSSQVQYEGVKDIEEFGAEINVGWKFGAKISTENSSSQTVDARYLGAPRTDGSRPLLQYSECQ
ncbi:hypothetical protein Kisp01_08610 [Kineosporia sp. NBRC 101677]|nr:hypothetical protein Kisp01_08610 [Kineosporia sp. NBRC 101677]